MLEVFNNAISNNEYYICLYGSSLYVYNYQEILSFHNELIRLKLPSKTLKIKGVNMLIKKMHQHELLIEGQIVSASYE